MAERRRTPSTRRRILRIVLGLVVAATIIGLAQLAWAGWHLRTVAAEVADAKQALAEGDAEALAGHVEDANTAAGRANWGTVGPHLWLAEQLPFVGDDVAAVRTVADAAERLTGPIAEDLLAVRDVLAPRSIRPVNGRIDVDRIASAVEPTARAAAALAEVDAATAGIDVEALMGPLQSRLGPFLDELAQLSDTVGYAAGIVDLLPEALGAEEERRYLLVIQNNAEFRSTGGLIAAFAVLHAEDGKLSLGVQGNASDLSQGVQPREVVQITEEERRLFNGRLGRYVQNASMTPHWPRSGEILQQVWQQHSGVRVDGVLSVDPVALSKVMEGTGPVRLPGGERATADTVVKMLLNDPYLEIADHDAQDAFFAASARRIFTALLDGQGDAAKAARGLFDAARAGRVLVWLTDEAEQQAVTGGVVDGRITREPGARPQVGVFFNDSNATKLDYYVTSRTDVARLACLPDGGQRLRVTTTLRSAVPEGVDFPPSLLGQVPPIGEAGDVLVTVLAYGSAGGEISEPTIDGERGAPALRTHLGHPVVVRTVKLEPGEEVTLEYVVETVAGQGGAPMLRTTPSARTSGKGAVEQSSCG